MDGFDNGKNVLKISLFLIPLDEIREKAQLLLDDPGMILNLRLRNAEKAQCSQPILRFCRRMGVEGFPEFKMHVAGAERPGPGI